MVKSRFALLLLLFSVACSRPANMPPPSPSAANPASQADVKLSAPASYPSGSTQSVTLTVARLDESKGVTASASGACSASGPAEKAAANTYRVSVNITAQPEDGTCPVKLVSVADGGAGSVALSYSADPEFWKRAAPAMYNFANSKIWTFHNGDDVKVFKLLEASPASGHKLAVLLVGDGDARSGMSVGQDNGVVGEYQGCVLEGKFAGTMAILKPMALSDSCKGLTTVTLMVSN